MKYQALQCYVHEGPTALRFELAGELDEEGARRLDQDWGAASSWIGRRRRIIDMTFVTKVDAQGRALISRWRREGARLIANSEASRVLAESILGEPLSEPSADAGATTAPDHTWLPFRPAFLMRDRYERRVAPAALSPGLAIS
jgi:hypothetical protein